MPFSNPTSNEDEAKYQAVFTHTNGIQIVIDRHDLVSDSADSSDSDDAIQAAIDVLNASPDFTFESAGKSYPSWRTITPTP